MDSDISAAAILTHSSNSSPDSPKPVSPCSQSPLGVYVQLAVPMHEAFTSARQSEP